MNVLWGMLGGFLAGVVASASNTSNMEGAHGYFRVVIAIIAGFAGMVAGMVLALRRISNTVCAPRRFC